MFADEWSAWHAAHERRRSAPHGVLAITGMYWLTATPQRFPDAPGEWSAGPHGVVVTLSDGEHLTLRNSDDPAGDGNNPAASAGDSPALGASDNQAAGDNPAAGASESPAAGASDNQAAGASDNQAAGDGGNRAVGDGGNRAVGDGEDTRARRLAGRCVLGVVDEDGVELADGDAVIEVARRGDGVIVRPRRPEARRRGGYAGTPAYPADEKWVIAGRFVPFGEPREVRLGTVVDGLEDVDVSPGRVEFEVGGVALALTVFGGGAAGTLMALFTDATSGVTTYAASRRLLLPRPGPDGAVTLDFNRATNLPCAYTEFATCALPPPENRLPVAIEAGEQTP